MLNNTPKTLQQIRQLAGEDCYQLLTIEGDDFTQIKGITRIAEKLSEKYPDARFFISSNPHDFGTYYGLEILDSDMSKYSDVEDESLLVAEELGYDI